MTELFGAELIGQSSYDSIQVGKKAGIVLILESKKDRKYWIRLNATVQHFNMPIDTWSVESPTYNSLKSTTCPELKI